MFEPFEIELSVWSSHAKTWAALLTGPSENKSFVFEREFCKITSKKVSRSGKNGTLKVLITEPGYYQISSPQVGEHGHEARKFIHVNDAGVVSTATENDVKAFFDIFIPTKVVKI